MSSMALSQPPVLIIVMGVSGSGKSTVAQFLAEDLNYCYLDADDFHTDEAKAQMAAGTPLTDAMRIPWVNNICAHLTQRAQSGTSCTLAFSGLRKAHRESLRQLPFRVVFTYLNGSKATIAQRMSLRADHFMPTSLLDSQFASMEDSSAEADVLTIDISADLPQVLAACKSQVSAYLTAG
ncbi:MAG TPA: gluconokinase, GntK/IdnK-type [Cellvibrionaceae bacterium]